MEERKALKIWLLWRRNYNSKLSVVDTEKGLLVAESSQRKNKTKQKTTSESLLWRQKKALKSRVYDVDVYKTAKVKNLFF